MGFNIQEYKLASKEDFSNGSGKIKNFLGIGDGKALGVVRVFGDYALKDEKTGVIDEIANTTIIPKSVIIDIKKI